MALMPIKQYTPIYTKLENSISRPEGNTFTPEKRLELVNSIHKMIWQRARAYSKDVSGKRQREQIQQDLFDAGLIGAYQAARLFNPNLGLKFTTFSFQIVNQYIWAEKSSIVHCGFRSVNSTTVLNQHPDRIRGFNGSEDSIFDVGFNSIRSEKSIHWTEDDWERLLRFLPPRPRYIVERHFRKGERLADIGNVFGISRERTRQILAKAMQTIRREVLKAELAPEEMVPVCEEDEEEE